MTGRQLEEAGSSEEETVQRRGQEGRAGGAGGRDGDVEMAHTVNGPAVLACWPGFGSPEPT